MNDQHFDFDFERARFNMIEQQIRPWNVLDTNLLENLSLIRREDFVPSHLRQQAFADVELPLGDGEVMLFPKLEARMIQDLRLQPHERVLEIGTGTGYTAALMSQLCAHVVTLETNARLIDMARQNLQRAGVRNVEVRKANGAKEDIGQGHFDAIILSGSVAKVPEHLLKILKAGGRLTAIVGQAPMMQMHMMTRLDNGQISTQTPWDIVAPRLHDFPEPSAFEF